MNLRRLLNTPLGTVFISIMLGLGLATLFRKVCTDKNCIVFNGPIISDFDQKIYQYGSKCYKYTTEQAHCDTTKKIVDITGPVPSDPIAQFAEISGTSTTPSASSGSLFGILGNKP